MYLYIMLRTHFSNNLLEAGCDEAGRGCLAGPVVAAAVIVPRGYKNNELNDSKKLSAKKREALRKEIEKEFIFAVSMVHNEEIDKVNILNASYLAMQRAVDKLSERPELLLIDGNRYKPHNDTPFECIIKGDGKYMSIAAASILAKTYRDEYMRAMDATYPNYGWLKNKGYPTEEHRLAIQAHGITPLHRKSFHLKSDQLSIFDTSCA
jgi:ribonuclease HII